MQPFMGPWEQEDKMKLSSRERFLIGTLLTIILWTAALEVFIWPGRLGYETSREQMESQRHEKEEMEFYLNHYEELEQTLNKWEALRNKEDFFYRDIDDTFMDRNLQAMADRVGVSICRMSIGEAVPVELSYDMEENGTEDKEKSETKEKSENGDGPAGGVVKESVITMEIECPDAQGVMAFSDEIYREQKSLLVTFMDTGAVYESAEDGREVYQGMKGIVEVRYYYEEIR